MHPLWPEVERCLPQLWRTVRGYEANPALQEELMQEVLLAAWMEWGEDCLHRLEGMFAFAVWDVQQELLVIARDRFGVKPLYYHEQEGRLLFAFA